MDQPLVENLGSRVRVSAAAACRLYGCSPAELRRRVRRGELDGTRDEQARDVVVFVDLDGDELPAQAAGRLLGIATPSVRAAIRAGRLEGRRDVAGWRVPLRALLADPRFPTELRRELEPEGFTAIGGQEQPPGELAVPSRLTRPVFVRLTPEEAEAFEQLWQGHGHQSRAVGRALLAEAKRATVRDEREELQSSLDRTRQALKAARSETEKARREASDFPSELYCNGCGGFVPLGELEPTSEYRDEPGKVWLHRHSGLRSFVAPETIVARS
jgi:hypothetical protein